jgi:hypothetical protein
MQVSLRIHSTIEEDLVIQNVSYLYSYLRMSYALCFITSELVFVCHYVFLEKHIENMFSFL